MSDLSRSCAISHYAPAELNQPDGAIRYTGRIDFRDPAGPRFAWAGCSLAFCCLGSQVKLHWRSDGENALRIRLDGQDLVPRLTLHGQSEFILPLPDDGQIHQVECIKLTECFVGTLQCCGLEITRGNLHHPPPRPAKRIEFIGDSITGGFGVLADEWTQYQAWTCDVTRAYSWLTAERLGFEPRISAWSGLGLVRNYDDSPQTWTERYPWVLPALLEQASSTPWHADYVVINLGTNDFAGGVIPDQSLYIQAYLALLHRLRKQHPTARLICCIGPILDDPALGILRDYVQQALQACALEHVFFMEFPPQQPRHGYGVTRHPSLVTQELMAAQLSGFIQALAAH